MRELMDSIPLWGILLGTIAIVLVASEIGFVLGQNRARRDEFDSEAQVGSLTAAHLGLLAFILAFSFSLAATQADKRKGLVLEEAIAIEKAYMVAGVLPFEKGTEIQAILRDYASLRAEAGEVDDIPLFIRQSEDVLQQFWSEIQSLLREGAPDELDALMVESGSQLQALHQKRVTAGVRTRVPFVLWISLYILLMLSMLGMGYFSGIKLRRSPLANTALSISFSMVMFLIADLDRPREGMVKPDQTLMKELSLRMH